MNADTIRTKQSEHELKALSAAVAARRSVANAGKVVAASAKYALGVSSAFLRTLVKG